MVNHSVSTKPQEYHRINQNRRKATRWHILGAGAMGCLWAASIQQHATAKGEGASTPVSFLLRDEQALSRWRKIGGVRIHSGNISKLVNIGASSIAGCPSAVDNLLVCTKAQNAMSALNSVSHLLHADSRVFLIQNGVKAQYEIAENFPALALYCISTSHGAYLHDEFDVVFAGQGDSYLGTLSQKHSLTLAAQSQILESLPRVSMNIVWDNNITGRLWTKFAINCAINALTVIYDCRNGELLRLPSAARELRELCIEIENIMLSVAECPQPLMLFEKVTIVAKATAQNISSTLQDTRKGHSTEIPYFNGYLQELAQLANVGDPLNDSVLRRFNRIIDGTIH